MAKYSHFTHLELVITPNTHEDLTNLDTGSGAVSLAESSSHSSLEPRKVKLIKYFSLDARKVGLFKLNINFSALWDFVFTFNQKQNWFRYHHVMENR